MQRSIHHSAADWGKRLRLQDFGIDWIVEFVFVVADVFRALVLDPDEADRFLGWEAIRPDYSILWGHLLPCQKFGYGFVYQRIEDLRTCFVATDKILSTRFDHVSILIAPASGKTDGSEH